MKFHRPRNPFRNPFRRKRKATYVAFTYGEAKELLKRMGPDDTLIMDEEGPPLFSSSREESKSARAEPKKTRKKKRVCSECGKELPAGWSMILCASCAGEVYGTIKDPPPPDLPDDYARIERDKDDRPQIAPVSVKGVKNRFRRNVLVGCVLFMIVCTGITVASHYYQPPFIEDYYTVTASMIETNSGDPSAAMMTLYLYQNESWVEHDVRTMLKTTHIFSSIPLGVWATVRVYEYDESSPEPAFARAVFVNSTDYSEEIAFFWEQYTIIIEGRGCDVIDT